MGFPPRIVCKAHRQNENNGSRVSAVYVLIDSWIDRIDPDNVLGSAGILPQADSFVLVRVGYPITRVAGVGGEAFMCDLASDWWQVVQKW